MDYKINIEKKVLRLLGAQLYGDTPTIIAELVQNSYDADAKRVWITVITGNDSEIIVEDDGIGMTPDEINDRFLNIGQDRRESYAISPGGRKVLGRKGIGKLSVFSLAKIIDVVTKKNNTVAACRLDFDKITLNDEDPVDIIGKEYIPLTEEHLSKNNTGTKIILKGIRKNISKSLNYIINRLLRTFDVNSDDFELFIRRNDDNFYRLSKKSLTFFDKMDTIITFGNKFSDKLDLVKNNSIDKKYKLTKKYEELTADNSERFPSLPYEIDVTNKDGLGVKRSFSFEGWIGTINERPSFKSFIIDKYADDGGNSKLEVSLTDNRITIFSRGKIGEFDILPKVQTNRIADAYIIGELYVDIFESDDLSDMAISNRRGYDETDQRYVHLIKVVSEVVSYITRRKEDINKTKKQDADYEAAEKIKERLIDDASETHNIINSKLSESEKKHFQNDLFQFSRVLSLKNETSKIFISHKSECSDFGKFLIQCFKNIGVNIENKIIFTSMPEFGVPFGKDIYDYLKECFRDDLYVIFLFSKSFYDSNICIAETGAAWATNKEYRNIVIDVSFSDIERPINNGQSGISLKNIEDEGTRTGLKSLIQEALSKIGYNNISEEKINTAINNALIEYKDRLVTPIYIPKRKFLATPICFKCGNKMKLVVNDKEEGVTYKCESANCGVEQSAKIL